MKMESSVITKKGQIVVPKNIRKFLGISPGTKIGYIITRGRVYIQPLDENYYKSLIGITGTKGKALKSLMEDKQKEREL